MWIEKNTEDLLNKLNNMPKLIWEETTTKVRFEATYMEVIVNMYVFNSDFQEIGHVTLSHFLDLFHIPKEYYNYLIRTKPEVEDMLKAGWIFNCFEYFDSPWIPFQINHYIEDKSVIFTLTPMKAPCQGCYDCVGWYEDCEKEMLAKNAPSKMETEK